MSGKFMNVKRIVIPTLTMVIIASQLMGCVSVSQSELLQMINQGDEIEIEVASPRAEAEQGEASSILWEQLALLTSNPELRKAWDDTLSITMTDTGKNGMLYVDADGNNVNNNTLRVALHNREFQKAISEEGLFTELAEGALNQYADIELDEETKALYMGINGYFNLLPDNIENYANPDSTLDRAEFMAMVMRAETPVDVELEADEDFATAVGQNDLNIYAQALASDSYLNLSDKSLNNMTYNGTITRAEAVYLLMNHYYADELPGVDAKNAVLNDAKDGGDIASKQDFAGKDYATSYTLAYATQNPDKGCPTALYEALVLAESKGIITADTRWDEALTRTEAVELLVSIYMDEDGIPEFNFQQGKVSGHEVLLETEDTSNTGGADVKLTEDEYNETTDAADATDAVAEKSTVMTKEAAIEDAKKMLADGIITEEEYQISLKVIDEWYSPAPSTSSSSSSQSSVAAQYEEATIAARESWAVPEGSGDPRTDIQYGQGDYTGLEHIRIN